MEAKQVWRAALGELQVSLSPANFETWLKDTELIEIDDNRYRISAPNGFARDWLDNRYRPLISQTLARVVGGSVQVEFVVADASGTFNKTTRDAAWARMAQAGAQLMTAVAGSKSRSGSFTTVPARPNRSSTSCSGPSPARPPGA